VCPTVPPLFAVLCAGWWWQILEPCQSSLAYQPPNPWTISILSLLTEIYNLPSLKMNLKFDIEVSASHPRTV